MVCCLSLANAISMPTPNEASLKKLVSISNFDQVYNNVIASIPQFVTQHLHTQKLLQKVPPEKQQTVNQIIQNHVQQLVQNINTPEFKQQLKQLQIDTLREIYTQEEIDAMIAFYSSPIGQSIINKQTLLLEYMTPKIHTLLYTHLLNDEAANIQKNMVNDINRVICGKKTCQTQ